MSELARAEFDKARIQLDALTEVGGAFGQPVFVLQQPLAVVIVAEVMVGSEVHGFFGGRSQVFSISQKVEKFSKDCMSGTAAGLDPHGIAQGLLSVLITLKLDERLAEALLENRHLGEAINPPAECLFRL